LFFSLVVPSARILGQKGIARIMKISKGITAFSSVQLPVGQLASARD
jgi:hypothetical protein